MFSASGISVSGCRVVMLNVGEVVSSLQGQSIGLYKLYRLDSSHQEDICQDLEVTLASTTGSKVSLCLMGNVISKSKLDHDAFR